jgi:flagellin-like protein
MTDIRGLLTEEDAVSPVIGVILMVAVTVVLSAAIGAFVLDIGNAVTEQPPNAVIEVSSTFNSGSSDVVTFGHAGGETLEAAQVTVNVGGATAWHDGSFKTGNGFEPGSSEWDDGVSSGDELVLNEDTTSGPDEITDGASVTVVWTNDGQSTILVSATL